MSRTRAKKPLQQIKTGVFSRGFALAKMSLTVGTRATAQALGDFFGTPKEGEDPNDPMVRIRKIIAPHVEMLTDELGRLKGSLMKAGQMLSMYGEHFLPPEANALLKSLQNQSPPLEWKEMEKVLKRQLGKEKLELLEIEQEAMASASLGQVHRARVKATGQWLALKIQYPGVEEAIEGDLKTLRSIFTMLQLVPRGLKFDDLFEEIRSMLKREVDYKRELKATKLFREWLKDDSRYVVPEALEQFSSGRVLATTLEAGVAVDSPEVAALSQERRNAIGEAMLHLYFREVFEFGMVQTDPHFGNYRIRLGEAGQPDRLVVLDFGAIREFNQDFLRRYREVIRACHSRDRVAVERGCEGVGFLREGDSADLRRTFVDLCLLITEPFGPESQPYDWGASDLPSRVAQAGKQMIFGKGVGPQLRIPPKEIVFLDRKMGGIFVFLAALKVRIRSRDILGQFLSTLSKR